MSGCEIIQQVVRNWSEMKKLAATTERPFAFKVARALNTHLADPFEQHPTAVGQSREIALPRHRNGQREDRMHAAHDPVARRLAPPLTQAVKRLTGYSA
jgi:hypothetical protein